MFEGDFEVELILVDVGDLLREVGNTTQMIRLCLVICKFELDNGRVVFLPFNYAQNNSSVSIEINEAEKPLNEVIFSREAVFLDQLAQLSVIFFNFRFRLHDEMTSLSERERILVPEIRLRMDVDSVYELLLGHLAQFVAE